MGIRRKTCVRYNEPWHAHSLTFSSYQRGPLFRNERACRIVVACVEAARIRHEFDIWAYVLMPEHVHLVIWPRNEVYSISSILLAIKRPASFRIAQAGLARRGEVWLPGGGYDRNLWTPAVIHKEIEYVHGNPVRGGLCENPEEWLFSSAAFWDGKTDVPMRMDDSMPPKEDLGAR